ncbi:hypothetical protein B0H65DRAFT_214958 [Neurospora tetraspora]|uniref:Uncharacterized protein n=1 Tax=Neurospora tetraspora TaxID=94610 RepID=A0AAE0JBY1_9PEZI|nr:hypothetical protein B0H65DRAFT_214958 [Neurospora tetraspora]
MPTPNPSALLAQCLRHLISVESSSNATSQQPFEFPLPPLVTLSFSRPSSGTHTTRTHVRPPRPPLSPRPTLSDPPDITTSRLLPACRTQRGCLPSHTPWRRQSLLRGSIRGPSTSSSQLILLRPPPKPLLFLTIVTLITLSFLAPGHVCYITE